MKAKELAEKIRILGEGTFKPAIDCVTYGFSHCIRLRGQIAIDRATMSVVCYPARN